MEEAAILHAVSDDYITRYNRGYFGTRDVI